LIDIWLIIILSVLSIPVTLFTSDLVRVVLGSFFVLFFPGYVLIAALFPEKKSLSNVERLALSFGLSIAVVPLIGLVLNYTPWGIRLDPILISLLMFILIMSVIALYRRRRQGPGNAFELDIRSSLRSINRTWAMQQPFDKIISVILMISIFAAIGTLGYVVATPAIGEKYTEFYILGPDGTADNYPKELVTGQPGKIILGIVNYEQTASDYRVEITIDGHLIKEIASINLENKGGWEQEVFFTTAQKGKQLVQFTLFKGADSGIYHELHLWIEGK
jgi:uncharacterized membrane protein